MKADTRAAVLAILAREPSLSWTEVARRVGVSKQRVHQIAKGAGKAPKNTGSALGHRAEYQCWVNMISRCIDPHHKLYPYYGGRGIRVCERWINSFPAFLVDMGAKPSPDLSIDRVNNDGPYEPGNCRWATRSQQINNRRTARLVRREPRRERLPPGREYLVDEACRAAIREAFEAGVKVSTLAKKYKVSRASIRNYINKS
jgi:hypothetical protein